MTTFDQGDVVLVNFPFTDLTSAKRRPALIVSTTWFNDKPVQDCILVAITSVVPDKLARDEVQLSESDLRSAGLPKPSIVKVGKIFTLYQGLIHTAAGSAAPVGTSASGEWNQGNHFSTEHDQK